MDNLPFINRYEETVELNKYLFAEQNITLFVEGASGLGKSRFVSQAFNELNSLSIKIEVPNNDNKRHSAGTYLYSLAKSIDELAKDSKSDSSYDDIELYQRSLAPNLKHRLQTAIKKDIAKITPVKHIAETLLDQADRTSNYTREQLFDSNTSEVHQFLIEYVTTQLQKENVFVGVENVQCIDDYSLECLLNIASFHNVRFVYEYTTELEEADVWQLAELKRKLISKGLLCDSIVIEPIGVEEFKDYFEKNQDIAWSLISSAFKDWKGSLRPLNDIIAEELNEQKVREALSPLQNSNCDPTLISSYRLKELSKAEQLIFTIICCHPEPAREDLIKLAIKDPSICRICFDINGLLSKLHNKGFIKQVHNEWQPTDDSISAIWLKDPVSQRYKAIAYSFWFHEYQSLLNGNDIFVSKSMVLQRLLYFSTVTKSHYILEVLEQITDISLTQNDPRMIVDYVKNVRSKLSLESLKESDHYIDWWMSIYLHTIGCPKDSLEVLVSITNKTVPKMLLNAILLEELGEQQKALRICKEYLALEQTSNRTKFCFELVRIACFRGLGSMNLCRSLFDKLLTEKAFQDYREYGFLLRNAELVLSSEEAIPYLKQSANHFENHSYPRAAGFSWLTCSFHQARIGLLKEAKKSIHYANELLSGVVSERHSLLNNEAAIDIYAGHESKETKDSLLSAMSTATNDFERLVILSNLLVVNLKMRQLEVAEDLIEPIEAILETPTFSDRQIFLPVLYNVMKFYHLNNESEVAEHIKTRMLDLNLPLNNVWKHRLSDLAFNELTKEEKHVINSGYGICFISHWHIDFDNELTMLQ